jgi:PAS domain S-box-containing protein
MQGHAGEAPVDWTESLLVITGLDGRLIQWSAACEALSGYRLAEVRGRPLWEVPVAPSDRAQVEAWFAGGGRALPVQASCGWQARDGTRHVLRWTHTVTRGRDGAPERVLATGVPEGLTPEVPAVDPHRLQRIFDHAFHLIGLVSPEGVVLEANRSALEFAGLTPADAIGRLAWEVPFFHGS